MVWAEAICCTLGATLCSDLPHTHTEPPPFQFHLPKSHLPSSHLRFGLHSETISVYRLWGTLECHASLAPCLSVCHSLSLAPSLAPFIVVQVIKRQAAPRWQLGGEDWREGQVIVTTTHWPHTHTHYLCQTHTQPCTQFRLFNTV